MNDDLTALLEAAKRVQTSREHKEEQRRTFAYGNTKFENDLITREMIDIEAEKLRRNRDDSEH